MGFLQFLEGIRTPFFDAVFSLITHLGEETVFLAVAIIVFWCVDKFEGYYLMTVGFIGTILNQFLKMLFRIPRPWMENEKFTIVESARAEATGYSFPSGHTQSFVGTASSLVIWNKSKVLRGILIVLIILVPFSRMYLGVHTPLDVGVSFLIAIALALVIKPIIEKARNCPKVMYLLIGFMLLISLANLFFVEFYNFPKDIDVENYQSALKNAYKLLGCILGLPIVYGLDIKFINFKTEGRLSFQIFKAVVGITFVLAVKEGAKSVLNMFFGEAVFLNAIRYFFVVLVAGTIWPYIFTKLNEKIKGRAK